MNAADELLGPALKNGQADEAAVIAGDRKVTYAELQAAAARCGGAFAELGVGTQDRVLLLADDGPEFYYVYLGAMKIGAVPVAINLRASAQELAFMVADSGCKLLVADSQFLETVERAKGMSNSFPPVVVTDRADGIDDILSLMVGRDERMHSVQLDPEDTALWMYTSGTTGEPKAAVHRLASLAHVPKYLKDVYGVRPGDRLFCSSNLFFAFSLGHMLLAGLKLGATMVVHAGWPNAEDIADTIETHKPDVVFSVPTFYRALVSGGFAGSPAFRNVRHFISAGERLPEPLCRQWQTVTGQPLLEGIGATEALVMFIGNAPKKFAPGATGKPYPGIEVKLTDEDGAPIKDAGVPGILWVKAPTLADGYWNQPDKTTEAFKDGWYRTGDMFVLDDKGWFHHQGRGDDMLKISGQWVSPVQIEERVLDNPKIMEAAVVGVTDTSGFVRLALCMILADPGADREALEEEICADLTGNLSIYKCPRRFVYLDDFPRTPTGKVQRFKLRQIAADEVGGRA